MSLLEKLFTAGRVLRAGESLKNPAAWKDTQMTMNAVLVILGAIPQFVDISVTDSQLNAISYGVVALLGVLNTYLTAATSDKVGVLPKSKN